MANPSLVITMAMSLFWQVSITDHIPSADSLTISTVTAFLSTKLEKPDIDSSVQVVPVGGMIQIREQWTACIGIASSSSFNILT